MSLIIPRGLLRVPALVLLLGLLAACEDEVRVKNGSTHQNGLLVDGKPDGDPAESEKVHRSHSSRIRVGELESRGGVRDHVIAFTRMRPPVSEPCEWTGDKDERTIAFPDVISLPVTVWIVKGPFDDVLGAEGEVVQEGQRKRALRAIMTTNAIFFMERMGVLLCCPEIVDATATTFQVEEEGVTTTILCADYYADMSSPLMSNSTHNIRLDVGQRPGRINIYYVDTVLLGAEGFTPGGGYVYNYATDCVVLGRVAADHLLAHELGHSFDLAHVDDKLIVAGVQWFDSDNIMFSATPTRLYLSEGQVFRAHFDENSTINSLYGARGNRPVFPVDTWNAVTYSGGNPSYPYDFGDFPAARWRIWKDGDLPAND